jgi:hypothetical protein
VYDFHLSIIWRHSAMAKSSLTHRIYCLQLARNLTDFNGANATIRCSMMLPASWMPVSHSEAWKPIHRRIDHPVSIRVRHPSFTLKPRKILSRYPSVIQVIISIRQSIKKCLDQWGAKSGLRHQSKPMIGSISLRATGLNCMIGKLGPRVSGSDPSVGKCGLGHLDQVS